VAVSKTFWPTEAAAGVTWVVRVGVVWPPPPVTTTVSAGSLHALTTGLWAASPP
jgi:hypothetical protein